MIFWNSFIIFLFAGSCKNASIALSITAPFWLSVGSSNTLLITISATASWPSVPAFEKSIEFAIFSATALEAVSFPPSVFSIASFISSDLFSAVSWATFCITAFAVSAPTSFLVDSSTEPSLANLATDIETLPFSSIVEDTSYWARTAACCFSSIFSNLALSSSLIVESTACFFLSCPAASLAANILSVKLVFPSWPATAPIAFAITWLATPFFPAILTIALACIFEASPLSPTRFCAISSVLLLNFSWATFSATCSGVIIFPSIGTALFEITLLKASFCSAVPFFSISSLTSAVASSIILIASAGFSFITSWKDFPPDFSLNLLVIAFWISASSWAISNSLLLFPSSPPSSLPSSSPSSTSLTPLSKWSSFNFLIFFAPNEASLPTGEPLTESTAFFPASISFLPDAVSIASLTFSSAAFLVFWPSAWTSSAPIICEIIPGSALIIVKATKTNKM